MKKFRSFLTLFLLVSATAVFVACEEEDTSSVNDGCEQHLEDLATTLANKSNTFSNNPTRSNCNAVRTAALNLIDAANDCDYGYLYEDQAQYWIDLDCSVFD